MGLKFVSENLQALPATDNLGNTGWIEKPSSEQIRSLVFFNNSPRNQYLLIDTPNSIPIKIPASTSFTLSFADLLAEDVHKITVFGTTADLVTIAYVTGSLSKIRQSLITLGLLTGSGS
jgi:hypothetical protein